MKTLRSATVKPVLATLLCFVGMWKVYTKGIDLANKHMLMAATAYNIKKMLRFKGENSIVAIEKVTEAELINVFFNHADFFCSFCSHSYRQNREFLFCRIIDALKVRFFEGK